jgi:hypothetical protein
MLGYIHAERQKDMWEGIPLPGFNITSLFGAKYVWHAFHSEHLSPDLDILYMEECGKML